MKDLKANQPRMTYSLFKTPIGWCGVIKNQKGLKRIFIGYIKQHQLIKHIKEEFYNTITKVPPAGELIDNISLFCSGEKISFSRCNIDWSSLTPFQYKVLKGTMKIPYGTVTTYRDLAQKIGCLGGFRAVGNALSKNPFPLLVPCHRIVRSDGKIGGFSAGGGKKLKEKLLRMEKKTFNLKFI
jgi:methylated-DNA-[protein]-cysteine S-methyltransferase